MSSDDVFAWSCLLSKFTVNADIENYEKLNKDYLQAECSNFPELKYILDRVTTNDDANSRPGYKETKLINLHAEALYRFKWSKCSNTEKLELYHLANNVKPNPQNKSVIEDLAMKGLIALDQKDRFTIINNSFRVFIKRAEVPETFARMQVQAEVGAWQNYKWVVSIIAVGILSWFALTSSDIFELILTTVAGLSTLLLTISNTTSLFRSGISKFE